jgi:hypothetical protein
MGKVEFEITIHQGFGGKLEKGTDGSIVYPENLNEESICAWMYRGDGTISFKEGMKLKYPEEAGKMCPWLLNDINQIVQIMRFGGEMHWTYENTPYEKVFGENGKTTEYIRCIDPTKSGIVIEIAKIENN